MRKDIKKRGFETGVLYELDDPADIYELADNEITQIKRDRIVGGSVLERIPQERPKSVGGDEQGA